MSLSLVTSVPENRKKKATVRRKRDRCCRVQTARAALCKNRACSSIESSPGWPSGELQDNRATSNSGQACRKGV
jgi:hypothetical protein